MGDTTKVCAGRSILDVKITNPERTKEREGTISLVLLNSSTPDLPGLEKSSFKSDFRIQSETKDINPIILTAKKGFRHFTEPLCCSGCGGRT